MSDDDEYYEFEDDLIYEDFVHDFVDELAQTSYYEAALYEDPAFDVQDYYSDWEYYSDDYYDDDPTVKQPNATTKAPATKSRRAQTGTESKTRDVRPQSSIKPDITSFQGVIWKTPSLEKDQDVAIYYEPGTGDKVALLKNWREIFKSAQPTLDKSRLRKRKMEDPVDDLSFADDESGGDDDIDYDNKENDHDQVDSSEVMSDVASFNNTSQDGDAGEVSNTTPEFTQSPKEAPTSAPAPAKRGRKRKAEAPADELNKDNPGANSTRSRQKRVESRKGGSGGSAEPGATTAPVRRSTRQKK
ncbi:hypothetical protein N7532_006411 [Penicillium argentinense]|uniref:Uncharacterized protein n=1 Tax=Penicillium argentinense TaxID=1131581 RepID=A0A9W9FFR7_9EURO|nr:uncharacterized protein N7532_006411 [Penicillium argentinense]KAJ5099410.1 hypothetical protein N7532_006411 [Penicillium argentinense]